MNQQDVNYRRTLVICDNFELINFLRGFLSEHGLDTRVIISRSPKAPDSVKSIPFIQVVNLAKHTHKIIDTFDLVISIHCKQLFPRELHSNIECINIHPGFNPETRGWFPQVWAIVNNLRTGITVHKIDEFLDHGAIISRICVPTYKWDTSRTIYERIIELEKLWIHDHLVDLLKGNYSHHPAESEGELFLKSDFDKLCLIDLEENGSFGEFYDRLRALTFDGYRNAYFIDYETGKKIYLELRISVEED